MLETGPHRIRRLRWAVRTESSSEAFAWRRLIRDRGEDLLPMFAEAFDAAAGNGRVRFISKIELRVGLAPGPSPEAQLAAIYQQLQEQLRAFLAQQESSPESPPARRESPAGQDRLEVLWHYLHTGLLPWRAAAGSLGSLPTDLTKTCVELWPQLRDRVKAGAQAPAFYFRLLQLLGDEDAPEPVGNLMELLPSEDREASKQLLGALLVGQELPLSRYIRLRLAAILLAAAPGGPLAAGTRAPEALPEEGFDEAEAAAIRREEVAGEKRRDREETLKSLSGIASAWQQKIIQDGGSAASQTGLPEDERQTLAEALEFISKTDSAWLEQIRAQTGPAAAMAAAQLLAAILAGLKFPPRLATRVRLLVTILTAGLTGLLETQPEGALIREPEASGVAKSSGEERQVWEEALDSLAANLRGWLDLPPAGEPADTAALPERRPVPSPSLKVGELPEGGLPEVPERTAAAAADLFPLLVQHAGLVLLHPFLPRLFEQTGILRSGEQQLAPRVRARGAALLHFLATGREEPYEYELGFIKVLVGLHPAAPLPVGRGLLRGEDREEAAELLRWTISHWPALKNTSAAGLRTSFLNRPALLRPGEGGWRLTVERRPYDLLLDYLPWSIGIVKLPWMSKAIFTEWTLS